MDINELTGAWDYASLPPNVHLGKGCYLETRQAFERFFSKQEPGLVLGDRVEAHTWTRFSVEPSGTVVVGDDSVLVGCQFMCAERISLGRRVIASYNVLITDSDFHPTDSAARRRDAVAIAPEGDRSRRPAVPTRAVTIEDDVRIGIGAIVLKGVHIGASARIGAGAVVVSSVPRGAQVIGNPARVVTDEDEGDR